MKNFGFDDSEELKTWTVMRNPSAPHVNFTPQLQSIPDNPKFAPINLDGLYEREWSFLIQEWKQPDEDFLYGHRIALQRLAHEPNKVIIIVVGDAATGEPKDFGQLLPSGEMRLLGTGIDQFRMMLLKWYRLADCRARNIRLESL